MNSQVNWGAEAIAVGGVVAAWMTDVIQPAIAIVAGLMAIVWYAINIRRALKNQKPHGDD